MRKETRQKLLFAIWVTEKCGINAGILEVLSLLDEYPSDPLIQQVLNSQLQSVLENDTTEKLDRRILQNPHLHSVLTPDQDLQLPSSCGDR